MKYLLLTAVVLAGLSAVGCNGENAKYMTEERLERGLVIILPGIEGESEANHNIRRGLISAGVYQAMPIHNWGRPIPVIGMAINQVDFLGNRIAGQGISDMIVKYQDEYPGRPVFIVGHSGGGGVAVFAAEGLPEGRQVDGLILLSASISRGYDLTKALSHCKNGIVNFYNKSDGGLLAVGTTILSNVDGGKGPSAGLDGFDVPDENDGAKKRVAYSKLYQIQVTDRGGNAHFSTTKVNFVATYVSPWISSSWPATGTSVISYNSQKGLDVNPATFIRPDLSGPATRKGLAVAFR